MADGFRPDSTRRSVLRSIAGVGAAVSGSTAVVGQTGAEPSPIDRIDELFELYRDGYDLRGVSVAITKDSDPVLVKGYGWADDQESDDLQPHHRFRIASVSKPITATAVMQLVEAGELALDDRVFSSELLGDLIDDLDETKQALPRPHEVVTIEHLLEHSVDWGFGDDPMFEWDHMNKEELVGHVLDEYGFDGYPGFDYDYQNLNYCILGLVIKEVDGRDYETYVQEELLSECGVERMEVGEGDRRKPYEVEYENRWGGSVDGIELSTMDAHGGWIGTPMDVLRFAEATTGSIPVDLEHSAVLDRPTRATMLEEDGPNESYALGWRTHDDHVGHGGFIRGVFGELRCRMDGYSYAVFVNTSPDEHARPSGDYTDFRDWTDSDGDRLWKGDLDEVLDHVISLLKLADVVPGVDDGRWIEGDIDVYPDDIATPGAAEQPEPDDDDSTGGWSGGSGWSGDAGSGDGSGGDDGGSSEDDDSTGGWSGWSGDASSGDDSDGSGGDDGGAPDYCDDGFGGTSPHGTYPPDC